jgi:hypothetical protein
MKWVQVSDSRWQSWRKGTKLEVVESGISEGYDVPIYHVRVNGETVDAADTLRDAKRLAKQCGMNLDY